MTRARVRPWRWLAGLAMLAIAAPALAQLLLSWPLAPPVIEGARVLEPGEPDGSHEDAMLATPRRIEVRFTTVRDLEPVRARRGMHFITAVLSACEERTWNYEEVITQRTEYLGDYGRVRRLGTEGDSGRTRYRAVFDNRLTHLVDGVSRFEPAIGRRGGLCLSLRGATMFFAASSAAVRLPSLR